MSPRPSLHPPSASPPPPLGRYTGTFSVQWRRRHNANVDKDAVITTVAQAVAAVAPEAKVALRSPMAAVVVEVIKSDAILAVLPRCEREEVGEGGG